MQVEGAYQVRQDSPLTGTTQIDAPDQHIRVGRGVKQQMAADTARLGGLRPLPARFRVIEQAMDVPAGRGAAAEVALRDFVEQA